MSTGIPNALRQLGWVEGQNLRIEQRYADGQTDRLPALARELVALRNDAMRVPEDPSVQLQVFETQQAAAAQGIELRVVRVVRVVAVRGADYAGAFATMVAERCGALFVAATTYFVRDRKRMLDPAAKHKLPSIREGPEQVDDGGLMSYGTSLSLMYQRIALGSLFIHSQAASSPLSYDAIKEGMHKRGWVVECNVSYRFHVAHSKVEGLDPLAPELLAQGMEPILVDPPQAARVLQKAGITVPVVRAKVANAVGSRFFASLARPGGNITGITAQNEVVLGKLIELLHVAVPSAQPSRLQRVIFLKTAKAMGITVPKSLLPRTTELIE
jgi:ABC-type uncharacterized transport system substrate-binding protein